MKIKIIAIGKPDNNYKSLIAKYSSLISNYFSFEFLYIKDETKLKLDKKNNFIIVLDEKGESLTSFLFSKFLIQKIDDRLIKDICFIIGGAFGLSDEIKNNADYLLSLSKMTFTHEMAQAFLMEQIYRAFEISRESKYHK